VRIGFLSSMANEVMPPVVRLFAERHPAVELQTADLPITELVATVASPIRRRLRGRRLPPTH